MNAITTYFKGVWHELQTVSWPSRSTVIGYTIAVIILSFFAGYFMGVFDIAFQKLLQLFVEAFK